MLKWEIRRPKCDDLKQLNEFFKTVITDTFIQEGIGEKLNDIKDELEIKEKYIESDLRTQGKERFFLIAFCGNTIIGSIEYGPVSELIKKCTNNAYVELIEVGTVFVHPDFQSIGVGNILLQEMYDVLSKNGVREFCLDSGYSRAQKNLEEEVWRPRLSIKGLLGSRECSYDLENTG